MRHFYNICRHLYRHFHIVHCLTIFLILYLLLIQRVPFQTKVFTIQSILFGNQSKEKAPCITQSALIIHRVVHLKRCKRGVNPFEKSSKSPISGFFRSTEIFCSSRQTVLLSYLWFSLSAVCSFPNQKV